MHSRNNKQTIWTVSHVIYLTLCTCVARHLLQLVTVSRAIHLTLYTYAACDLLKLPTSLILMTNKTRHDDGSNTYRTAETEASDH